MSSPPRDAATSVRATVLVCVGAIVAAQGVAAAIGPVAGAMCSAVVLAAVLSSYVLADPLPERRILPLLGLVPLLSLFSFAAPTRDVPMIWWYPMVGAPFLIAVFLAGRLDRVSWSSLLLRAGGMRAQAGVVAAGVPLSGAAYAILRPEPLISPLTPAGFVGGALVLTLFSAFAEEVVFRGLLQDAAGELLGGAGTVVVGVLFASLYTGSLSALYVAFVGGVGLVFAGVVERSGVLWGVVGAHAILNVGLLIVWPSVYG